MLNAMFGDTKENTDPSDNEWSMPKLKSVVKGDPIVPSLASLINTACTSQCKVDDMMSRYKVPQNCYKLCPPLINSEIWKILDKQEGHDGPEVAHLYLGLPPPWQGQF
jgi:hypothetical protein